MKNVEIVASLTLYQVSTQTVKQEIKLRLGVVRTKNQNHGEENILFKKEEGEEGIRHNFYDFRKRLGYV